MDDFYGRCVFFVKDAERSLAFYTQTLGFSLDWNHQEDGRTFVFQVSLLGFQLILNQAESWTEARVGHGRVFVGIDDDQVAALREHVKLKGIETRIVSWGAPTLLLRDLDGNELLFSLPRSEWPSLEAELAEQRAAGVESPWGSQEGDRKSRPRVESFAPQFLVDDLARSIAFYQKLGFTFGEPWDGFYAIGELDGLELHLKEAPKSEADRQYRRDHEHLDASAGVDGIEAFYEKCLANGVTILRPLTATSWGTKNFYVEDPDGYVLAFGGRPSAV